MTETTGRPTGLVARRGRSGRTDDRAGRGAPGSGNPAPTKPEAGAAAPRAVASDELVHLRELTQRAQLAFGVARDAFLQLETAHQKGRPGTEENAAFQAKVSLFRRAAHAVHQAAMRQHGPAGRSGGSAP